MVFFPGRAANSFFSCDFITGLVEHKDLLCGKLAVPEDHESPAGKMISIAYVIIKARDTSEAKHPVILLGGGPGVEMLSPGLVNYMLQESREDRDLIIVEQRGIGHSSGLPSIDEELEAILAGNYNEKEEQQQMDTLMLKIRQLAREQNIDLTKYNTWQNARDIGALMEHLGYNKYNILGTSYGTRLGRIVQDLFPEYLNSAVYNSPALAQGDMLIDRLINYSTSLQKIFEHCEADPECNAEYPDLRRNYQEVITTLRQDPLKLEIDGKPFYINAQDAIYYLRRSLYGNEALKNAPLIINELKTGGGPLLIQVIENEFGFGYNHLMWLAVERSEMYDPENTPDKIAKVYESLPLLPAELGHFSSVYRALGILHNASLPEEKKQFRFSEVPTLIMVNQYDPVTPPKNGYIFMNKLSKGYLFVLDEGGHGGGNESCRNQVISAFLNNPNTVPDASCFNLFKE